MRVPEPTLLALVVWILLVTAFAVLDQVGVTLGGAVSWVITTLLILSALGAVSRAIWASRPRKTSVAERYEAHRRHQVPDVRTAFGGPRRLWSYVVTLTRR